MDISNTYAKLEKLTILAKKKSLFDDRPVEIQDLTYIIKQVRCRFAMESLNAIRWQKHCSYDDD